MKVIVTKILSSSTIQEILNNKKNNNDGMIITRIIIAEYNLYATKYNITMMAPKLIQGV